MSGSGNAMLSVSRMQSPDRGGSGVSISHD